MEMTPPLAIPLSTATILDNSLPPQLLRSYARLLAAAWHTGYRRTEELDFDVQVVPLLALRRSQARQHLRLLRIAHLVDWTSDGDNRYTFTFPGLHTSAGATTGQESSPMLASQACHSPAALPGAFPGQGGDEAGANHLPGTAPQTRNQPEPLPPGKSARTDETDSVVGVDSLIKESTLNAQQHIQSAFPDSPDAATIPRLASAEPRNAAFMPPPPRPANHFATLPGPGDANDPDDPRPRLLRWLATAGVWSDAAYRIAGQITENAHRGYNDYLPDLGDVLDWIAYCFADREKNKLTNSPAVLAANLNLNRRCPAGYRPEAICRRCGYLESYCECDEDPQPHFPDAYLQAALHPGRYNLDKDRWGVCNYCHALPCQCYEDEQEKETPSQA